MTKQKAISEVHSAIFCETGLFPCDGMIKFILRQSNQWVNDLANLVRYTSTNKRIQFESELTKVGYKESGETFTYTIE